MKNLTFILSYYKDSDRREKNLFHCIDYIQKNFYGAEIIVSFWNKDNIFPKIFTKGDNISVIGNTLYFMNKSKLINAAAKECITDHICVFDIDCWFPPDKMEICYTWLKKFDGETLIYPYDGRFYNISDYDYVSGITNKNKSLINKNSVGGCFFIGKSLFERVGMMNENFISWGYEDNEFYERCSKFKEIPIIRILESPAYHIDHPRGVTSSHVHDFYEDNKKEYLKIKEMPIGDIKKYISTWPWV